ncbi:spherulation-specific family 4 protein [Planctomonas psychrotolerans]|uniref:spherulation-specific family 4 protein n=1 Tax=Planctomonas psychrotolerans TaxID=2528712 RepID=UPI001D0D4C5F|nr:spherulation-specific family 4 protein [Planctomonas psychrotolerans]
MKLVRKRSISAALTVGFAAALAVSPASTVTAAPRLVTDQRQLVPAYFSPAGPRWANMCQRLSMKPGPSTAIMNPASGPGDAVDVDYRNAIDTCHALGQRVIGYVTTDYTGVSLDRVKDQIDAYYSFYPEIDGIFLDAMSNTLDRGTDYRFDAKTLTVREYYRLLRDHITSKPKAASWSSSSSSTTASTTDRPLKNYIVGNAGAGAGAGGSAPWQLSMPVVDNLVVFEGSMSEYRDWTPPDWLWDYPAAKISQLVYGAAPIQLGPTSFGVARDLSRQRNAGHVYITADTLPNPYDTLTTYWPKPVATPPKHICCMRMQ